jgi:uncharacterized membrane protein YhaH (DUF805 family)
MSKPVFSDLFSFSGRRNRKSYTLFALANFGVMAVIWMIAALIMDGDENATVIAIAGLLTLVCVVSGWAVAAQRCRDFGWTGWALLLTALPVVGWIFALALFFIPGTQGANRYGPDLLAPDALYAA